MNWQDKVLKIFHMKGSFGRIQCVEVLLASAEMTLVMEVVPVAARKGANMCLSFKETGMILHNIVILQLSMRVPSIYTLEIGPTFSFSHYVYRDFILLFFMRYCYYGWSCPFVSSIMTNDQTRLLLLLLIFKILVIYYLN